MKRLLLAGSLAVLALLALWWLWGRSETSPIRSSGESETLHSDPVVADSALAEAAASQPGARAEIAGGLELSAQGIVFGDPRMPVLGAQVHAHRGQPEDQASLFQTMFGMMAGAARGEPQAGRSRFENSGPPLLRADVAADGGFRFERIPARDLRLTLDHTHYGLDAPVVVHDPSPQKTLILEPVLGAHVLGRIEGHDGPLPPGAKLRLALEPDPMSAVRNPRQFSASIGNAARTETPVAADGLFELRAVPPSARATLLLEARGYHGQAGPFPLAAGETREVVLRAQRAFDVEVAVQDEAGAPIAKAAVVLRPVGLQGEMTRTLAGHRAESGADGVARVLDLRPGQFELEVEASGFLPHEATREVHEAGERWPVTLLAGGAVDGRVIDAANRPVAGAGIVAVPAMKVPMLGDVAGFVGDDLLALPAATSRCRTDAEGRFRLTGLHTEAEFGVAASHRDYVPTIQREVRAGQHDVTITLRPAARVRGRVVTDEGRPVPEFEAQTVVTMMMVMTRPTSRTRVTGSTDGAFELTHLAPGTVTLQITAPGFARAEQKLDVETGAEVDAGTITLVRAATIRGFVRDEAGAPIPVAAVKVQEGGMNDHPLLAMMLGAQLEHTDRDGAFTLTGIRPGRVVLNATARGFASGRSPRLEVGAGQVLEGIELRLGHGGTIRGRLLLAEGRSVQGFEVIASVQATGASGATTPRPDGTFVLENLDPGRYQVQAMDVASFENLGADVSRKLKPGRSFDLGGMLEGLNQRMVQTRCAVKAGEVTEVTLDARELEGHGITLVVRATIGERPVAEGMIEAAPADGSGNVAVGMLRSGVARLTGLARGALRVQVRTGMMLAPVGEPKLVELEGTAEQSVTLRLPDGRLGGKVVEASSGRPLALAVVKLLSRGAGPEPEDFGFAVAASDGTFAFEGLAEGDFAVIADETLTRGDGAAGRIDGIRLGPGEHREGLVLHARAGSRAAARVVDEWDAPVARAMILAIDDQGRSLGTRSLAFTDGEGRATLSGLPAARCRIVGRAEGFAPAVSELREVLPGEEVEFPLRLPRGTPTAVRVEAADGRPLRDASISCRFGQGPWLPATLLLAGPPREGEFDLGPLPAGPVRFRISGAGTGSFEAERAIPGGGRARLVLTAPK